MNQEKEYTPEEQKALDALTPQQRGFVLHYIEHGSPKNAFIANYRVNPENPRLAQKAYDMMKKSAKMVTALEVLRRGISKRNDVSLDTLVQELVGELNDAKEVRKLLLQLAISGNMADKLVLRKIDKLTLIDRNRDIVGAVKQISQMLGYNLPKKIETTNNLIQINVINQSTK